MKNKRLRTTHFARIPPKKWHLIDRLLNAVASGCCADWDTLALCVGLKSKQGFYLTSEKRFEIIKAITGPKSLCKCLLKLWTYFTTLRLGTAPNTIEAQRLAKSLMSLQFDNWSHQLANTKRRTKRTCSPLWMGKSLFHPKAKLWIHQGRWLLIARLSDRNLSVKRWLDSQPTKKKRRLWATLTPMNETRIDLKGAPLTLDGRFLRKSLKRNRSEDIYAVGYT